MYPLVPLPPCHGTRPTPYASAAIAAKDGRGRGATAVAPALTIVWKSSGRGSRPRSRKRPHRLRPRCQPLIGRRPRQRATDERKPPDAAQPTTRAPPPDRPASLGRGPSPSTHERAGQPRRPHPWSGRYRCPTAPSVTATTASTLLGAACPEGSGATLTAMTSRPPSSSPSTSL